MSTTTSPSWITKIFRALLYSAIAAGVGLLALVLIEVRLTQLDSHSAISVIKDCTSPKGSCYRRAQTQNRQTIDSINEVSVYAATCAKRYSTVQQIEDCVLAFIHDRPQPKLDRTTTPSTPTPTASPPTSPKADRGSGPAKPKSSPAPSKPTKTTKPTKPTKPPTTPPVTPPVTSPSPPVASPTPGLCLLDLICIR